MQEQSHPLRKSKLVQSDPATIIAHLCDNTLFAALTAYCPLSEWKRFRGSRYDWENARIVEQLSWCFALRKVCKRWRNLIDARVHCSLTLLLMCFGRNSKILDSLNRFDYALSRVHALPGEDWKEFLLLCCYRSAVTENALCGAILPTYVPLDSFIGFLCNRVPNFDCVWQREFVCHAVWAYQPCDWDTKMHQRVCSYLVTFLYKAPSPAQSISLLRKIIPMVAYHDYERLWCAELFEIYLKSLPKAQFDTNEQLYDFAVGLLRQRADLFRDGIASERRFYRCVGIENSGEPRVVAMYDRLWMNRESILQSLK